MISWSFLPNYPDFPNEKDEAQYLAETFLSSSVISKSFLHLHKKKKSFLLIFLARPQVYLCLHWRFIPDRLCTLNFPVYSGNLWNLGERPITPPLSPKTSQELFQWVT